MIGQMDLMLETYAIAHIPKTSKEYSCTFPCVPKEIMAHIP